MIKHSTYANTLIKTVFEYLFISRKLSLIKRENFKIPMIIKFFRKPPTNRQKKLNGVEQFSTRRFSERTKAILHYCGQ